MRLEYDGKADAVYIRLRNSKILESEEVSPGVVYDFDEQNQVVGIEILELKDRSVEQLRQLDFPFSAEDRQQLSSLLSEWGKTLIFRGLKSRNFVIFSWSDRRGLGNSLTEFHRRFSLGFC